MITANFHLATKGTITTRGAELRGQEGRGYLAIGQGGNELTIFGTYNQLRLIAEGLVLQINCLEEAAEVRE